MQLESILSVFRKVKKHMRISIYTSVILLMFVCFQSAKLEPFLILACFWACLTLSYQSFGMQAEVYLLVQ